MYDVSSSSVGIFGRVHSMSKSLIKIAAALLLFAATVPARAPANDAANQPLQMSASRMPEVKLRKLHLVRPDLIPFPVFFEVYA